LDTLFGGGLEMSHISSGFSPSIDGAGKSSARSTGSFGADFGEILKSTEAAVNDVIGEKSAPDLGLDALKALEADLFQKLSPKAQDARRGGNFRIV